MKKKCYYPGCTQRASKKYKGYRDYHLCKKHYNIVYGYFSRIVCGSNNWRCFNCGRRVGLEIHHVEYRSQGGRNIFENCLPFCKICHGEIHGQTNKDDGRLLPA